MTLFPMDIRQSKIDPCIWISGCKCCSGVLCNYCTVFLDQRIFIFYNVKSPIPWHESMQHLSSYTKTYSVFCLLFCCSSNLDDTTHILQTFYWSLSINIYPFAEWWDIFQPTFIGQSYHLKSNKVPWGAMEQLQHDTWFECSIISFAHCFSMWILPNLQIQFISQNKYSV